MDAEQIVVLLVALLGGGSLVKLFENRRLTRLDDKTNDHKLIDQLQEQINALLVRMEKVENKNDTLNMRINELEKENAKLETENNFLKNEVAILKGENC